MNSRLRLALIGLLAASMLTWAQMPGDGGPAGGGQSPAGPGMGGPGMGPGPRGDLLGDSFFPPELVMQYQKAIGLTEDQRTAIRTEMQKTVARFTELQWQQQAETEKMNELVQKERVEEKDLLAQFDKLVTTENEIKRLHLALLVRIKNALTPEQQQKLRELRPRGGQRQPGGGDANRGPRGGERRPWPPPGEQDDQPPAPQ